MDTSAQLQTPTRNEILYEIIDRAVILDRVGGDEELLREITAIFMEEYPSLIHEIEVAVHDSDAKRLEKAAHSLKGSVANFGAHRATQAAYRLETLGRRGELGDASVALNDLLFEFHQLQPALEDLVA
jgi:two-component system, sensor histidine kinase and response regulator